jgi:hypothetical protein
VVVGVTLLATTLTLRRTFGWVREITQKVSPAGASITIEAPAGGPRNKTPEFATAVPSKVHVGDAGVQSPDGKRTLLLYLNTARPPSSASDAKRL